YGSSRQCPTPDTIRHSPVAQCTRESRRTPLARTPPQQVISRAEDSPSGLGRSLGKRVEGDLSGVRIPYPPPRTQDHALRTMPGRVVEGRPGSITVPTSPILLSASPIEPTALPELRPCCLSSAAGQAAHRTPSPMSCRRAATA